MCPPSQKLPIPESSWSAGKFGGPGSSNPGSRGCPLYSYPHSLCHPAENQNTMNRLFTLIFYPKKLHRQIHEIKQTHHSTPRLRLQHALAVDPKTFCLLFLPGSRYFQWYIFSAPAGPRVLQLQHRLERLSLLHPSLTVLPHQLQPPGHTIGDFRIRSTIANKASNILRHWLYGRSSYFNVQARQSSFHAVGH